MCDNDGDDNGDDMSMCGGGDPGDGFGDDVCDGDNGNDGEMCDDGGVGGGGDLGDDCCTPGGDEGRCMEWVVLLPPGEPADVCWSGCCVGVPASCASIVLLSSALASRTTHMVNPTLIRI